MQADDPRTALHAALALGDAGAIAAALRTQATGHADTARSSVKMDAVRRLSLQYRGQPEELRRLGLELSRHLDPSAQEVGAVLLAEVYPAGADEAAARLTALAASPNWEVREWAASAAGEILGGHLEHFLPVVAAWTEDPSDLVRRAAVLALMYAGTNSGDIPVGPVLDLLESLLTDASPYVRKNLAPFAVGSELMRRHPGAVLERLQRWSQHADERIRRESALAFTAAAAADLAERARPTLERLRDDPNPSVRRALGRALRVIQRRLPGFSLD